MLLGEFDSRIMLFNVIKSGDFIRIPDNLGIKSKMLYAGSKAAILQVLTGVAVKINATDRSEVTKDIIDGECRKFN